MAMKKDNDQMKEQIDFVIKGGDPKKVEKNLVDGMFADAASPEGQFRTPHIDNVFDLDSEFHPTSAGINPYTGDKDQGPLRTSKGVIVEDVDGGSIREISPIPKKGSKLSSSLSPARSGQSK